MTIGFDLLNIQHYPAFIVKPIKEKQVVQVKPDFSGGANFIDVRGILKDYPELEKLVEWKDPRNGSLLVRREDITEEYKLKFWFEKIPAKYEARWECRGIPDPFVNITAKEQLSAPLVKLLEKFNVVVIDNMKYLPKKADNKTLYVCLRNQGGGYIGDYVGASGYVYRFYPLAPSDLPEDSSPIISTEAGNILGYLHKNALIISGYSGDNLYQYLIPEAYENARKNRVAKKVDDLVGLNEEAFKPHLKSHKDYVAKQKAAWRAGEEAYEKAKATLDGSNEAIKDFLKNAKDLKVKALGIEAEYPLEWTTKKCTVKSYVNGILSVTIGDESYNINPPKANVDPGPTLRGLLYFMATYVHGVVIDADVEKVKAKYKNEKVKEIAGEGTV